MNHDQPPFALLLFAGCLAIAPLPALAQAQPPVEYDLSFDNAVHHEARITVTYRGVDAGPLTLRMSRSSPGRYAVHEFAKNVYSVSAHDGAGRLLPVIRVDPYSWTVAGHDRTVTVTYTLFADRADGTYSQVDASHAHLNMPATLMWAEGFDQRPVRVRFKPFDPRWKVATQLAPTSDPYTFSAPNFQYLMDSPAELSNHDVREWQVNDGGQRRTIRLAIHHQGSTEEADRLAAMTRKVVEQQIAAFGDVPDFDYNTYTFLVDALPWASGDGMEHRNSTYVTSSSSLAASDFDPLGTISHEFVHAWNVERLRPRDLEPFDFTRANWTSLLWLGEGFTHYYGPLFIHRAGQSSLDDFLEFLSGTLDFVVNSPGRRYGSPEAMSRRAPFLDAAVAIDPVNPNISTNYYPYGAVLGLALDLELRARGQSLDALMRALWGRYGVTERPYTHADVEKALAEVSGDAAFARRFFETSIRGSALPDLAPLLARAGFTLRPEHPTRAYAGAVEILEQGEQAIFNKYPAPGTPIHAAGVSKGDRIISLGNAAIANQADWTAAVARHRPGDRVRIRFVQRGQERSTDLVFAADPALKVVRNESLGQPLTPAQRAFRADWLGQK